MYPFLLPLPEKQKWNQLPAVMAESDNVRTLSFSNIFSMMVRLGLARPHVQPCPRKTSSIPHSAFSTQP